MLRVSQVAYAGAILMIGLAGCSAEAQTPPSGSASPTVSPTGSPTGSPTAAPTATTSSTASPAATRPSILVQLNPDRVTAGETSTVWVLANCPEPTGGPAHSGTATSRAFVSGVTLNPADAATSSPSPTGARAGGAWVRGQAQVNGTVRRGSYRVDVKCDGTNHVGRATLRVRAPEPLPDDVPTKAPRAGGGGTFGKDVDEGSSIPLVPVGLALGVAAAAGIGIAVKRRRS
ncbi:hypothetical protein [Nonomuraea sp. NPDC023979]|uniref:hypothetical protein n=1 Tax=unclassified Nonomuraea TaxID=2593643 RepID=UPI0033F6C7F6